MRKKSRTLTQKEKQGKGTAVRRLAQKLISTSNSYHYETLTKIIHAI